MLLCEKKVEKMRFYNKYEADRYGLATEAIGDMIAACSSALYHEMLTDDEREVILSKMHDFHLEDKALNINDMEQVGAVIEKYCPLLKNGMVTIDYLLNGKAIVRKSA